MFVRGVADGPGRSRLGQRGRVALVVVLLLAAGLWAGQLVHAVGSEPSRCQRFAAASAHRAAHPLGHGVRDVRDVHDVVVIGDSWSVGLGLARPREAWPSRLPGTVHVAGFSGSGFSAHASSCGRAVAFDRRAAGALGSGADLVVVEGGLNDFDQSDRAIRGGFARLMAVLRPGTAAYRVVVVGPASAPSRAARVPRVDRLLRTLAMQYDVGYVGTSDLALPYLPDHLHLTPAGHREFGNAVAARIAALSG